MAVDPAQVRALLMEFERPLQTQELAILLCEPNIDALAYLLGWMRHFEFVEYVPESAGWRLRRETGVSP